MHNEQKWILFHYQKDGKHLMQKDAMKKHDIPLPPALSPIQGILGLKVPGSRCVAG